MTGKGRWVEGEWISATEGAAERLEALAEQTAAASEEVVGFEKAFRENKRAEQRARAEARRAAMAAKGARRQAHAREMSPLKQDKATAAKAKRKRMRR